MENLAHTLTGVVLARTRIGKSVPRASVTLAIAANLPDIDVVSSIKGPLHYLYYHRGVTHSLVGTVVLGLLMSVVVWLLGKRSREKLYKFPGVLAGIMPAALTHPLLDLTNSYGLRPFLPFFEKRYFGDLVFIVDPVLWIVLGGAAFLTARRTRVSRFFWLLGTGAVLLVCTLFAWFSLKGVVLLIAMGVAFLLLFGAKRYRPIWGSRVAVGGLLLVCFYWGTLYILHEFASANAIRRLSAEVPVIQSDEFAVLPRPVSPLRWDVLYQDRRYVYLSVADVRSRVPVPRFQLFPRNLDDPAVKAALDTCPGQVIRYFGRFTFFEATKTERGTLVHFRDARFSRGGRSGFGTYPLQLDRRLKLVGERDQCPDLSVRGVLAAD